jgi:hypothetical protein
VKGVTVGNFGGTSVRFVNAQGAQYPREALKDFTVTLGQAPNWLRAHARADYEAMDIQFPRRKGD